MLIKVIKVAERLFYVYMTYRALFYLRGIWRSIVIKRTWYECRTIEDLKRLMTYVPSGKIVIGHSMVDGRRIDSIGFEGCYFVISASY